MRPLLEKLHKDHINLARLLDLMSHELDALSAGHEANFDLKIEMLDYIEHYAEQSHHPTEDQVNKVAFRKKSMKEHKPLYERITKEHSDLIGLARNYRKTLEGAMQGEVLLREEVETRGREFVALQRQHIDLEEQEVFPLVESVLSDKDWQKLEAEIAHGEDPLFNRQDYNRFRSLIDYLQAHEDE
ncbi:MAG: purine catabolism protein pucG [gamma proteobacterium symbiont of Ctena orbiculata]|uniref:Hemerythrin domain-containing protein n=1 Tax=Candidatus Thiodiazotropha taylori TaxID=2792791 RepID=A0A944QUU1_9GAMM|nr:hemerythrin domain-containing protein [Candidatus Thiodiazotropha taylori]PUB81186.1 MAG: purine catabolism protein pucG [gamma proteobacterium symbiont of Ctena orbiculata]MBT2990497.1 hemerythrin domain-containing protein [Candidatus Thiodiazotropha taylori]MBT2998568.1 hemerythrin domain-containing protein [Candidatus Thiodiazotropha taylori]MBT3002742.1 hemerythrin domain-containing protein [Candidatus Thiodiazotropha taylori]